jgi:hypothetical protein
MSLIHFKLPKGYYRLPEGTICLLHVFKVTSSVSFIASSCMDPRKQLDLDIEGLRLSLDEFTEFTIFGFMMIVVRGLLSFHHLKKLGHFLLQHLQQQQ